MLAALELLKGDIGRKNKGYVVFMIEKHRIDVKMEALQKKKNSAVYIKIEKIF